MMATEEGRARIGGIEKPDYIRPTYANYVTVNHTPWDFRFLFAVVKTPNPGTEMDQYGGSGVLHPEAVAEVIVPANLMHGLISALQDNFSKYLAQFGPPGLDPEGPRHAEEEDD